MEHGSWFQGLEGETESDPSIILRDLFGLYPQSPASDMQLHRVVFSSFAACAHSPFFLGVKDGRDGRVKEDPGLERTPSYLVHPFIAPAKARNLLAEAILFLNAAFSYRTRRDL